MKKRLNVYLVLAVFLLQSIFVNANFNYDGYARDCECGIIPITTTINVDVKIISGSFNGALVYNETHSVTVTTANGLYLLDVGNGTPIPSGSTLPTLSTPTYYYIKVKVDGGEEVTQKLDVSGTNPVVEVYPDNISENAGIVRYFEDGTRMQFFNGTIWANICCGLECDWMWCGDVDACDGQTTVTITDPYDNSTYKMPIVSVGCRCWFAENLNIGVFIKAPTTDPPLSGEAWQTATTTILEKYCWDNDPTLCDDYGGYYQWDELMNYSTTEGAQGICPSGWHIPTLDEFYALKDFYGGSNSAYPFLISDTQQSLTGMGILLTGLGYYNAPLNNIYFMMKDEKTYIWSSTVFSGFTISFIARQIDSYVDAESATSQGAHPVRCIKD